jgi:DNA-binding Lrp family transcriptional regulator
MHVIASLQAYFSSEKQQRMSAQPFGHAPDCANRHEFPGDIRRNARPLAGVALYQVAQQPRAEGGTPVRAYVLVQTETAGESLSRKLMTIPGVVSADDLTGAYDAIVLAGADSMRQLIEKVISKILALPGVTRALPAPVIPSSTSRTDTGSSDAQEGPRDRAA